MDSEKSLTATIRDRIVSELHIGHLHMGERLPSVRELSRELGVDHRAVARAYRELEEEGLVEVRGSQGAFVAHQERLGGELLQETARWIAGVAAEAARRRIPVTALPEVFRSYTARLPLRCAVVESNRDTLESFCTELGEDFGLAGTGVMVDELPQASRAAPGARLPWPEVLREADLLVTSSFYTRLVSRAAEQLGKPLVVVSINPDLAGIIERHLARRGQLTVIAVDERFGERMRATYARSPDAARIRLVLADDHGAVARLSRAEPVLLTRPARRLLPDLDLPLLVPRYPSISAESTRELTGALIRLNAGSTSVASPPPRGNA